MEKSVSRGYGIRVEFEYGFARSAERKERAPSVWKKEDRSAKEAKAKRQRTKDRPGPAIRHYYGNIEDAEVQRVFLLPALLFLRSLGAPTDVHGVMGRIYTPVSVYVDWRYQHKDRPRCMLHLILTEVPRLNVSDLVKDALNHK